MASAKSTVTGRSLRHIHWHVSRTPVPYRAAETFMHERARKIANGSASELIWLLEHPSIYTAGTSAQPADLLNPGQFPVLQTNRGGQYTYHGPGQRVVYVMLDLREHGGRDVRKFVVTLQQWLIEALATFDVHGQTHSDRIGIWVPNLDASPNRDDKIAAIGIRLVKWISLHGISLNISPNLSHYDGIKACGIDGHGITSLKKLGVTTSQDAVDRELKHAFCNQFRTRIESPDHNDGVQAFP